MESFPFTRQLFTNELYLVHQDGDGYMWFDTTSSLQRWDGHRMLTFRSDDIRPNLIPENSVCKMADTDSLLWILTDNGVIFYDKSDGRFSYPDDPRLTDHGIIGMLSDKKGGVWLTTKQRVFHCDASYSKVREHNPFSGMSGEHEIFDISIDNEGNLWILCRDGLILKEHKGTFRALPCMPNGASACTMYQDMDGRYWVGTWGHGLWQCFPNGDGPEGKSWLEHHVFNSDTGRDETIFFCICQDHSRKWLWMLSYNKIYVFSYNDGRLSLVDLSSQMSPHHYYTSMTCDRDGNMWITAYDGGYTVRFDESGVSNVRIPELYDGNDCLINLLTESGYVWMNSQRHGLQLMNRESGRKQKVDIGLPEIEVMRPSRMSNSVWAAQKYYSTVYRLRRDGEKVIKEETIDVESILDDSRPVRNIVETRTNTLLLLTQHHLVARVSGSDDDFFTADLKEPTAITISNQADAVLCACEGQFVCCEVRERRVATSLVASLDFLHEGENVTTMAEESDGKLWLSTTLGRTFRSDSKKRVFRISPIDSLLCDGLVQDMLVNGSCVWIMNDKRVVCYDASTKMAKCYDAGMGNVRVEGFRHHALCADKTGVLAGGIGGFVCLPNSMSGSDETNTLRSLRLTDVLIDGVSVFFSGDSSSLSNTFFHVVLPADAHNIELHLSELTYSGCLGVRLQYRLKGMEEQWTDIEPQHFKAHYNNIPRGIFTLQVRRMNDKGEWSDCVNVTTIERLPAWYDSTVAFVGYAVLLLLSFFAVAVRIKRRHAQELRNEVTQAKVSMLTADHHLTDAMVKIVDEHLSDSDFSLEQLLSKMGMSKSTLYRQLKTETDMTPSDLIRSVRMKRATEMLLKVDMNVSEVAYATGFSSPKYFSRCFKEEYGVTPTDYVRQHADSSEDEGQM